MKAKGTAVYTRQHGNGPTLPQLSAIDLLASGQNDTETAAALGLSRTTVSKWRLYDAVFQAALNRRRAEVWSVGADKLRALIPRAIDALASELAADGPNRLKAALEVLRLAQLPAVGTVGPTDADDIVCGVVNDRRDKAHGPLQDLMDGRKGLPPYSEHVEQVRAELEQRLAEADDDAAEPTLNPSDDRTHTNA
ncbi:MAG: helix-turn-helix domain-containing protein [Gemmataceae bacterium]